MRRMKKRRLKMQKKPLAASQCYLQYYSQYYMSQKLPHRGRFATSSLILLAIASAFSATGCRKGDLGQTPIAVNVATLQRESVVSELRYSASVREWQRIELSFKVPGTVEEIMQLKGPDGLMRDVHEGDIVTADPKQPLAALDDSDYKRRVEAARDQLTQVHAKQRAAQANLTAAKALFNRIAPLRERGSVSQQNYDDVLAKRDAAQAQLDEAMHGGDAADVALRQAVDDLAHCSLRLPIPKAVVSRKNIEKGERVPAGAPVMEVMDVAQLRVAFAVPDTRVNQFKIGQTTTVTTDAMRGERFTGKVTKISPAADLRTRSFEVEVTIDKPGKLRPGMVVTILVGQGERMILLPMTAVQRDNNRDKPDELIVFVIASENGKTIVRRRSVKVDGIYDNRIRLIEGRESSVREGDAIVVTGAFRLADGLEVRVLDVPTTNYRIDE
jgi:RND family efflux transporter MFP subunit